MMTNLPIPHKKYSASELENFIIPEDHIHERICNFPEWQKYFEKYPHIHEINRDNSPEFEYCAVELVHNFLTDEHDKEEAVVQKQIENFFKDIGFNDKESEDYSFGDGSFAIKRTEYYFDDDDE